MTMRITLGRRKSRIIVTKGKKIITVVGARPQFIKLAAVSRQMKKRKYIREIIVHTGQHYDDEMSAVFFRELDIPKPDYQLNVGSGNHGSQTGAMLTKIETVLLMEKPDLVLVYGDTNSTLAGALAATKLHIPVAHVEAGLRSFNRNMPEEINRILTDHISDLLFAPTNTAVQNLLREGIKPDSIMFAGDVMYDIARYYAAIAKGNSRILERYGLERKKYVLSTLHRAENTDNVKRLEQIIDGLASIGQENIVVLPVHPRTKSVLKSMNLNPEINSVIMFIEPVGYLDMIMLEMNALVIMTDSGGVQKEAFFHRVPCVTIREETEWIELLELGWNRLVAPLTSNIIVQRYAEAIRNPVGKNAAPYGYGQSSRIIVEKLQEFL